VQSAYWIKLPDNGKGIGNTTEETGVFRGLETHTKDRIFIYVTKH
jgi:hypothetical protein